MKKIVSLQLVLSIVLLLCACGTASTVKEEEKDQQKLVVHCVDENGSPVEGVSIQLCTDTSCFMTKSDAKGEALFDLVPIEANEYSVHVYKLPENYEMPEKSEIEITSYESDISIVIPHNHTSEDSSADVETSNLVFSSLEEVDFSQYKLVMLNYWEVWCPWCLKEMPDLERLWQKYKDDGLLIIGMYTETQGLTETLKETGVTYPVIHYTDRPEYMTDSIPMTIFFDSNKEQMPALPEEFADEYIPVLRQAVENPDSLLPSEISEEEREEYLAEFKKMQENEDELYAAAIQLAEIDVQNYRGTFVGIADYDTWERRIMIRLYPKQ